jgi:hypothetical protein
MTRALVALLWGVLVGASARADEDAPTPAAIHSEAHEADRERDGPAAKERLRRMLADILAKQARIDYDLRHTHGFPGTESPGSRGPVIGSVGAVTIARSGRAVVQHAISWGPDSGEELSVHVTASDDSLVVPEKLALEFEKHQFRFEYEIRSGDQTGAFTITLTPAVGEPVEVEVIVE